MLVVGLPLLPGGTEGSQAELTRRSVEPLREKGVEVHFVDERYTTQRSREVGPRKASKNPPPEDLNAAAACQILEIFWSIDKENFVS